MKRKQVKKMISAALELDKGTTISNCSFEMNLEVGEVVQMLAEAMTQQAIANQKNSQAISDLSGKLIPSNATAIRIGN